MNINKKASTLVEIITINIQKTKNTSLACMNTSLARIYPINPYLPFLFHKHL